MCYYNDWKQKKFIKDIAGKLLVIKYKIYYSTYSYSASFVLFMFHVLQQCLSLFIMFSIPSSHILDRIKINSAITS